MRLRVFSFENELKSQDLCLKGPCHFSCVLVLSLSSTYEVFMSLCTKISHNILLCEHSDWSHGAKMLYTFKNKSLRKCSLRDAVEEPVLVH